MFKRKSFAALKSEFVSLRPAPSLITEGLFIRGDLESASEIQLDGFVEGDIKSHTFILGVNGHLKGDLYADKAVIYGTVDGNLYVKSIFLSETARIRGDIYHDSLAMESGAYVKGTCHQDHGACSTKKKRSIRSSNA